MDSTRGAGEAPGYWLTRFLVLRLLGVVYLVARTATVPWLEAIYNRRRRHSGIDMLSPVDYEEL
jgi:transposase InsO family protein